MKLSPYMNINRIEFIVTYQCSGHCKHCSVGDKCNPSDGIKSVSADHAAAAIKDLSKIFPVSSVMTFGGEPLLYADVVCTIHQAASQCGIGARQLITNGYFTKDDQKRRQTAEALKAAGVNHLLLSIDAFHQETIPAKEVYDFAACVKAAQLPNIRLHPAWVVTEQHDNPYNKKTKEVLSLFADLDIPVSTGNNIFMAGNATAHLGQYYDKPRLDLSAPCGSMPYTEPLTAITSLTIVPNGDVVICDFVIGNIYRSSIKEIVTQYDPTQNEWMNAIITGGVSAMLALSRQKGADVDCSQCYSVCDVCRKINQHFTHTSQR